MSREIKFRVFAHQKDDDGCVGYLETRSPVATGVDFLYDGGWRGIGCFLNNPNIFTVEHYTGFKDKNGKEIYEGDIVKYHYMELLDGYYYEVFQVVWDTFFHGWALADSDKLPLNHTGWKFYNLDVCGEVIGNIFENPKLIKTEI